MEYIWHCNISHEIYISWIKIYIRHRNREYVTNWITILMYSYFFAYSECASTTTWWTCPWGSVDYYERCNTCFYTFQLEGSFVHTYYPVRRTWAAYCSKRIACAIEWNLAIFQARILHATRDRIIFRKNNIILGRTRTLSVGFITGIVQREI